VRLYYPSQGTIVMKALMIVIASLVMLIAPTLLVRNNYGSV
jgi:hypothetical protein